MFIEKYFKSLRAKSEKSGFLPIDGGQLHSSALPRSGMTTRTSSLQILQEILWIGKCTCSRAHMHCVCMCMSGCVHVCICM